MTCAETTREGGSGVMPPQTENAGPRAGPSNCETMKPPSRPPGLGHFVRKP